MADLNITTHDGLIEATIKTKQETYYLVTDDNLSSLKQKGILSDLFVLLASLAWGAFFSITITIKSNIANFDPEKPSSEILEPLTTLKHVFLYSGILFSILAVFMFIVSYLQIRELKKGKLDIKENNKENKKDDTV